MRREPATSRRVPDPWVPDTDTFLRDDGDLEILLDLPGVRKEDIEVSLYRGSLTVYGRKPARGGADRCHTLERRSGDFGRVVGLPESLNESYISCQFEDCVLQILIHGYSNLRQTETIEVGGA